jgi:hypothetical protein
LDEKKLEKYYNLVFILHALVSKIPVNRFLESYVRMFSDEHLALSVGETLKFQGWSETKNA